MQLPKKETSTEQRIIEVAESLFLKQGYLATSTVQIAKEAGCNQALVHYYFKNKEHLFETVFELEFKKLSSFFFLYDKPELAFADRLKIMLNGLFDLFEQNERLPFFMLSELMSNADWIDIVLQKAIFIAKSTMPTFYADLQNEINAGRVRNISPFNLLTTIISLSISPFLMKPIVDRALELPEHERQKLMQERRIENVTIVMRSLMP